MLVCNEFRNCFENIINTDSNKKKKKKRRRREKGEKKSLFLQYITHISYFLYMY